MSDRLIEEARIIAPISEERDYIVSLCDALEDSERTMRRAREALEPRAGYWSDEEASAVAILDEALARPTAQAAREIEGRSG